MSYANVKVAKWIRIKSADVKITLVFASLLRLRLLILLSTNEQVPFLLPYAAYVHLCCSSSSSALSTWRAGRAG